MTAEMLRLAQRNARSAGVGNVCFVQGQIERLPLPAGFLNVAISNCAVNLALDRAAVLREVYRVLSHQGRLSFVDALLEDRLSMEHRVQLSRDSAFITTLLSVAECIGLLEAVGFRDVRVRLTHEIADGLHAAAITCAKPGKGLPSFGFGTRGGTPEPCPDLSVDGLQSAVLCP